MKYFITGATGFIGTYLCHRLISEGNEVFALVRSPQKAKKLPAGVRIINGDLSVFNNPEYQIPQCDIVIHLAGLIGAKTEKEYFEHNYHATVRFVECLKSQPWKPGRFLYTSSLAAAGPSNGEIPLTETMNPAPIEPYGKAKQKAEKYMENANFPVTSFRPGVVLGAGDENSLTLFKMAKAGIGMKVAGINQKISCIDVEDLVDAILKMSLEQGNENKIYFAVHHEIVDMEMLWDALGRALGKKVTLIPIPKFILYTVALSATVLSKIFPFQNKIDLKMYRQMIQKAFVCSPGKLQGELGWQPRYNIYETVVRAADGYKKMGKL